jgi:uncharacterized membrane protein
VVITPIGLYRWYKTPADERFYFPLKIFSENNIERMDKILVVIVGIMLIITFITLIYVYTTPKERQEFTEFYWLGPTGIAGAFDKNITVGKNYTLRLGVINHEYRTLNYTLEIWLINQSTYFNDLIQSDDFIIRNMWYLDRLSFSLDHIDYQGDQFWNPQWEQNYTFSLNKTGLFKLTFFLFTSQPSQEFEKYVDYKDLSQEKLDSAYREIHLWVNVS